MSLRALDTKFGTPPLRTRYLTDRSSRLPMRDIRKLRQLLQIFERKFPQSLFSVFVTDQLRGGTIAEYTFWLANRARFSAIEAIGANNFDLILGIDLTAGAAALCVGYGLEEYVSETDLNATLEAGQNAFAVGDVVLGIRNCVDFMTNRMRDIVKQIEQDAAAAAAEPLPADF